MDMIETNVGSYGDSYDTVSDYDGVKPFKTSSAGNHTHTATLSNTGGNKHFSEMPPYTVVFMWKRTA